MDTPWDKANWPDYAYMHRFRNEFWIGGSQTSAQLKCVWARSVHATTDSMLRCNFLRGQKNWLHNKAERGHRLHIDVGAHVTTHAGLMSVAIYSSV